ncbi:hypothetical protein [Pediococcus acidilactici]|uniref:hypothetical protein n=1 Tax=Pediococcus acidilactici TaxID=1254 RepID=UPI002009DE55|nr:hypothetical protein [Pediococcus acidilactici]UPU32320.1 hypothetical protein M1B70_06510 [Pediococcus acidilactici]
MWQLIGVNSKEVYGESKHKSDLHKWMLNNYTKFDEIAEKLGMTGYNVASHWYRLCKKKVK